MRYRRAQGVIIAIYMLRIGGDIVAEHEVGQLRCAHLYRAACFMSCAWRMRIDCRGDVYESRAV